MNFVTTQFLVFLVFVFFVYWHLPRKAQNIFILLASYFFYACWDWRFLSLIIISTLVDYTAGPKIQAARSERARKGWMLLSLGVNLGILGYFKYFNFFAGSFASLLSSLGMEVSYSTLNIVLPVGISFYTFQTLSYTLDIYRGKLEPTRNFIDFATFVAFFPQLVAGPIVRAKEFVHQLEKKRVFSFDDLQIGATRFLYGFFKKAFIADTLAVNIVDPVFANPADYSSGTIWLSLLMYTIQIYADFSGYSNMAIGSARMLGFEIPENFNFPYLARNISEYWRRWHRTMSRFFRDYVYISLGGNREKFAVVLRNICITVIISGLWHGAGWTFVIWGMLHGFYIVVDQLIRRWQARRYGKNYSMGVVGSIIGWSLTMYFMLFARLLFRSQDFSDTTTCLVRMFTGADGITLGVNMLAWVAIVAFFIDHVYGWFKERHAAIDSIAPYWAKALLYASMIIFLYHARPTEINPFIYFQF